jgi:ankyrin repeat protein
VNATDNESMTPLHYAAMRGNVTATKTLLQWPGINIEVTTDPNILIYSYVPKLHNFGSLYIHVHT